uniref:Ribulose bisphosphate carboxylase small subunit, chloroplastic n=1 Tax=Oryza glumipatula TaxID=40148 RepID=A0A0E0BRJ3_9ORYZ
MDGWMDRPSRPRGPEDKADSHASLPARIFTGEPQPLLPNPGLESTAGLPVSRRSTNSGFGDITNGGRIKCMQVPYILSFFFKVWPVDGKKKFETLSYLPSLTAEDLLKQIEHLLYDVGFIYRGNHRSPGYYDGRYWTIWKLPMFGYSDNSQVIKELEEAKKAYPDAFIHIVGFDNVRHVQCISFIAYKPPERFNPHEGQARLVLKPLLQRDSALAPHQAES